MDHFFSRWPDMEWDDMVRWCGAEPVVVPIIMDQNDQQAAIYQWLRENRATGTFVGNVPGAQCWHVKGNDNRLLFALRWA